jgi:HEAT repeat protein
VVRLSTFDARPKDLIAVLTWESRTADLDLHVWDSFGHHTFNEARDPYQCDAAIPAGLLDMDKKGDYGPEVFSLESAEQEVYTFYVKFSPGVKKENTKAYLRLLLHGDEPSLRIMRWLGPDVMGDVDQVWEAAHVKMPEGIFFQEKDIDLVKTLGMDTKAVQRLALMLEEENPSFRLLAISAMGQIKSEDAVGPLLKALTGGTPEIRRAAAGALWNIKSMKSVDGLIAALKDLDPEVRRAAAGALGGIGDTKALYSLNGLLSDEADPLVRVETIRALGRLGDPRALYGLLAQARDTDPRVRVEAVRAMGALRAEKAEDMLKETLADKSAGVREVAAWALGRLGLKSSVKPLLDALDFDDCEGVRAKAAAALGRIKDEGTADDLRKDAEKDNSPSVRYCASKALEGMAPRKGDSQGPSPDGAMQEAPPAEMDQDLVVF